MTHTTTFKSCLKVPKPNHVEAIGSPEYGGKRKGKIPSKSGFFVAASTVYRMNRGVAFLLPVSSPKEFKYNTKRSVNAVRKKYL